MSRPVPLIISIDTEEDNWNPRREGITVENIRELPRLDSLFQSLGVRATYFVGYQVAIHAWAAAILRELRAGGAEIGAHLHPWNTPPVDEPFLPRNTMLKNLPFALQAAKLARLTAALEQAVGARPVSFRAGRYALGPETVTALLRCGYEIDSSVTPFVSWEAFDDGATFVGAPLEMYRLGGGANGTTDVRIPDPDGRMLEVPMSVGYSRRPFGFWSAVLRFLATKPLRWLHGGGVAWRLGIIRRIFLSPEMCRARDMVRLSRLLLEQQVGHLHLFFHSTSLRPGLSPYCPDQAAVEGLYRRIAAYVEALERITPLQFVTVGEAAAQWRGPAATAAVSVSAPARAPLPH